MRVIVMSYLLCALFPVALGVTMAATDVLADYWHLLVFAAGLGGMWADLRNQSRRNRDRLNEIHRDGCRWGRKHEERHKDRQRIQT